MTWTPIGLWMTLAGCGEEPCAGKSERDCRAAEHCFVEEAWTCDDDRASTYGGCLAWSIYDEGGCGDMGAVAEFEGECLWYASTCVPDDTKECTDPELLDACWR